MKVKELIQKLQTCDQDLNVWLNWLEFPEYEDAPREYATIVCEVCEESVGDLSFVSLY